MKNMIKLPAIMLGLLLLLTGINQKVFAQDEDISLQTFYDELSPYGTWIQDQQYGYVWRPDVDQEEFRPYYSNGHWVMTEYGNTWVSDYEWGWAPFHYGRWVTDRFNQWLWIPDTTWGPAWVNWRTGGGNYGWAPLGPSISVGFNIPSFWWVFVPQRNLYYDRFPRYHHVRNRRYLSNTVIINNVYVHNRNTYYTGPRRDEYRRVTNRDVTVYNINRTNRPGRSRISNNTVHIYNPRPVRGADNRNAAPRKVVERDAFVRNARSTDTRVNAGRDNIRMERPERNTDNRNSVNRPGMDKRSTENRSTDIRGTARPTGDRSAVDQQRLQAQRQQRETQQRQQRDGQRSLEQNQQRETQQRQQRDGQRSQQQAQQRSQEQNQQRASQRQEMSRPQRAERVQVPQRATESRSTGNSGSSRSSGATRETRGSGRG